MTNFIFSRRDIQLQLDRLTEHLTPAQVSKLADRLNKPGRDRLSAMWEVVVLAPLTAFGNLRHEKPLPNGRCPEFELAIGNADRPAQRLVGDVTAVSDDGLDDQNPFNFLWGHIQRLARKHKLQGNFFYLKVNGAADGDYGDAKMRLSLPSKGRLQEFARTEVEPWMQHLKSAPGQSDRLTCKDGTTDFAITYTPGQRFGGGGYPAYTVAGSLTRNPLFNALKAKVSQLNGVDDHDLRIIVACDGGSSLLNQQGSYQSPGTYTAAEVTEDFLRQYSSIDAVALIKVVEYPQQFGSASLIQIKVDLILSTTSPRISANSRESILALANSICRGLPQPQRTAINAARRCLETGVGPPPGGYSMSNSCISISVRALQQLLSGEITQAQFLDLHGWSGHGRPNPFALFAMNGRMIEKADIDITSVADDSRVTFHFGHPDPAIAPFIAKARSSDKHD